MLAGGAAAPAFQATLRRDTARQVRLATNLQRFATTRPGRFVLIAGLTAVPTALAALAKWTRVEDVALAPA
jgi:hypothetical protein